MHYLVKHYPTAHLLQEDLQCLYLWTSRSQHHQAHKQLYLCNKQEQGHRVVAAAAADSAAADDVV